MYQVVGHDAYTGENHYVPISDLNTFLTELRNSEGTEIAIDVAAYRTVPVNTVIEIFDQCQIQGFTRTRVRWVVNLIKLMRLSLFNNEDEPEVSMSPLIDCVFLLLIFFLVSTMTKVKNRDISVDLPTSESAIKLKPDDKQAIVGLDAEGNFYWDGQPCSTNFMMEQLRETCISDPGRRIRIDMDKNTPFGRFVEVMDACQFYNLTNIGIRTYDENYNRE